MAESALDLFAMAAALADDDESDGEGDGDQGAAEDGETRASAEALRKQLETFLEEGTKEKAADRVHFGDLELRDASELAPEEFERDFLARGRPLALLGCADAWEARSWTAASLGDTYGDASFALYTGQKFTLREYLSYAEGRAEIDECPLYLFEDLSVRADAADAKSAAARDAILAGYEVPRVFAGRDLFELASTNQGPENKADGLEGRPRFRWLLIGPARSGTRIHYDPVGTSAWNTLLEGHKRWVLIPPDVPEEEVRRFRRDVNVERWFAEVLPTLDRAALGLLEFTQAPGDTVFVPRGWWHIVINLDMTVAVTQNFASSASLGKVTQAMRLQKLSPFKTAWFKAMQERFPDESGLARRVPLPASFAEGLEGCKAPQTRPNLWGADDEAWMHAIQQRYDELWSRPRVQHGPKCIPRIVHHIWLGSKNIPNHGDWVKSWQRFLADEGWELRLWRDADISQLDLQNRRAFETAANVGERSDIARYEILRRYGGVYVDVDFECVRSITEFMNEMAALDVQFICGLSNVGALEINNAFIASTPGHPVLEALVERVGSAKASSPLSAVGGLLDSFLTPQDQEVLESAKTVSSSSQTISRTGPGMFTRVVLPQVRENSSVLILPPRTLYPLANDASPEQVLSSKDYAAQGALAVHHWARSWQK